MIGLFGGSFDPIHLGHLLAAQSALESLTLDELWFVPAFEQPFKRGSHGAAPALRARMVSLAIAGVPRFRLETCELDRGGPSYTVDTLRTLKARDPSNSFALLVGADTLRDFPAWREASEIPRLAQVVAFGRPGSELREVPGVSRTITVPRIDISATEIRNRVASGLPIRYWVPEAVERCIVAEGLYLTNA
jgi:nicotinate-nucleotide adenylyltransferase